LQLEQRPAEHSHADSKAAAQLAQCCVQHADGCRPLGCIADTASAAWQMQAAAASTGHHCTAA
jgi:hypothetical protein